MKVTAREYLAQVSELDALINAKLSEISRLRLSAESTGQPHEKKRKICYN